MRRRDFTIGLLGSATAVWPLTARAQQKTMPVIGYLSDLSSGTAAPFVAAFRQGLSETGYVEGRNVAIEYRWAEGQFDRLAALAADLVGRKVDVIATTVGAPTALAAKHATLTIPVVFSVGVDPVATGLVSSLARPGGNLTGITVFGTELIVKRLELLSELAPRAKVIAMLVNPTNPVTPPTWEPLANQQEAARAKGARLQVLRAATENEIDAAFATLVKSQIGALLVGADPLFNNQRERLVALAAHHGVPALYSHRAYTDLGGLISYGPNPSATYRQIGIYAGKILDGEKPANLPVQQPTKFDLVINLKTASALGLTMPQSLLVRADEVIE